MDQNTPSTIGDSVVNDFFKLENLPESFTGSIWSTLAESIFFSLLVYLVYELTRRFLSSRLGKKLPSFGFRSADRTLAECPHCGVQNRIAKRPGARPICGRCKNPLSRNYSAAPEESLAERAGEQGSVTNTLLLLASVCFLLGICWPLISVSKHVTFWIFNLVDEQNTISLASGLKALFARSELFLFTVLFLFTIVFPLAKFGILFTLWFGRIEASTAARLSHLLAIVGKWSMVDIFVVGILVALLKLGDTVSVQVHAGTYFFGVSAILTMLLTIRISKALPTLSELPRP